MEFPIINSRADLDAIKGTPAHAQAMKMLEGTLWKIQADHNAKTFVAIEDDSVIKKLGLKRSDFKNATPPELPAYTEPSKDSQMHEFANEADRAQAQTNVQARTELAATDWYVIRQIETGIEIPPEIKKQRQKLRESVVEITKDRG